MLNTILLIDDNEDDNFCHRIMLEDINLAKEIIEFQYARDALGFIKTSSKEIELILLDINMPKMNGFEFLDHYSNLDSTIKKGKNVFMLTTSLNPDDKNKVKFYPDVKGFLHKPLDIKKLKELLSKL